MISKLPRWVEFGAFILAFVAGYVNAVGLLGFEHQSVSHLSGTATLLGTELISSSAQNVLHLIAVLVSFFLGAGLSGFILHGSTLRLGRHYDTALYLECILLLGAMVLLNDGAIAGHYLASAACGLQNALATTYSGAIVRTTHVTGIFTDLGIMFGAKLRGESFDKRKAILFLIIISGFVAGGLIGAVLFDALVFNALIIPCAIVLVLGVGYRIYNVKTANKKVES